MHLMAQRHAVPHLRGKIRSSKIWIPCCRSTRNASGAGVSMTSEQRCAAAMRIFVTSSVSASTGAGTVSTTRVTESDSDQLINCSVMNALFGTIISFRSQSLMVVARVLMR